MMTGVVLVLVLVSEAVAVAMQRALQVVVPLPLLRRRWMVLQQRRSPWRTLSVGLCVFGCVWVCVGARGGSVSALSLVPCSVVLTSMSS